MSDHNSTFPGRADLSAEAAEALLDARRMPHGAERIEALKRAGHLRNAADTYSYLFSVELASEGT
jgi:hypothetical protein